MHHAGLVLLLQTHNAATDCTCLCCYCWGGLGARDAGRFLGLISHIDFVIPAPEAPCKVLIRDGKGQEMTSAAAASTSQQQQQQQQPAASAMAAMHLAADAGRCNLMLLEQQGKVPDKLYVLKDANASGLASLQQEITPGMLDAWVKHVAAHSTPQVKAEDVLYVPICLTKCMLCLA
jgi:hypothetical protein